tara:strand:- start:2169 stop:3884 length:1716 start_codon:yes stop_codon:yes gene_type:complete
MSFIIPVKYYNSFWLKKIEADLNIGSPPVRDDKPIWPGLPDDIAPSGYPQFPGQADFNDLNNWFVEETRIKGGFNEDAMSLGNRAYLNLVNPTQRIRAASLIYSGPYNPNRDFNQTNVFSVGEEITKSLDPANGSIQRTFAEDTNLTIFQENKVNKVLIDKDALYSAEGEGTPVSSNTLVLGQVVPYLGKYGIGKNPESFGYFGMRKYFVDPNNNTVMRLSRDGLTEISKYGMKDYFRDELNNFNNQRNSFSITWTSLSPITSPPEFKTSFEIDTDLACKVFPGMRISTLTGINEYTETGAVIESITSIPGSPPTSLVQFNKPILLTEEGVFTGFYKPKLLGEWDNYNKYYTLSLQNKPTWVEVEEDFKKTVSFDETVLGWVSFFSYKPTEMFSVNGKFFSTINNSIYQHYQGSLHANYYGTQYKAGIIFVLNDQPSTKKVFKTVNYEGDNGWQVDNIVSSEQKFTPIMEMSNIVWNTYSDNSALIRSYLEGEYVDSVGNVRHAGFDRKENLYVSQINNAGQDVPGQVISNPSMTGLKGYFVTVSMSTDSSTNVGGEKELWSVGSNIVQSS